MVFSEAIRVVFPADSSYLVHIRTLVADAVNAAGFGQKFAYRTELVVDELLGQAIRSGGPTASVQLLCEMGATELKLSVSEINRSAVDSPEAGLDIVRMLSNSMEFTCNESGESTVQVVRTLTDTRVEAS